VPRLREQKRGWVTEDDLYEVEFLEDDFECRDCSLKGDALDGEAEQLVSALKRLDGLRSRWGQIWAETAIWRFGSNRDHQNDVVGQDANQHMNYIRSEVASLWEDLAELARQKPDFFSMKVEGENSQPLETYIPEHWEPDEATNSGLTIPIIGTVSRWRKARTLCKRFESHLNTVRSTLADELKQHQRGHW